MMTNFEQRAELMRLQGPERKRPIVVRPLAVEKVLRRHAGAHGMDVWELTSGPKTRSTVKVRREAMRELRGMGYSLTQIGKWVGGRHHTSVLFHVKADPPAMERDLTGVWDEWI